MADPRAFISFDFDNNSGEKLYFVGQSKNSRTPFNIEDWSSKAHLPQNEWEKLIHAKINKCNILIVLVGRNMSSATGVAKEISFAKEHNVPVFGIYVDKADENSNLPAGLQRNRTINWNWDRIANAIDQCMTEGKNK
ncbi:TIR domain-containing protein [Flavobacterium sp. DGU38]|uniref:TIR domain-containing protein n=1 Tax=Flavobacterium calami TaxID=3139144 RepID=A0ABU9IVW6_9FLAO